MQSTSPVQIRVEVRSFHDEALPHLPVASVSTPSILELTQLIQKNRSRLGYFVRKHLRNDEHTEDLLQQTCLEAFRNWGNFRGDSKPETWLFGIALNLVKNFRSRDFQTRYHFESLDEEDAQELEAISEEGPMERLLRDERVQKIREAISALPTKMQLVVQLVLLDGMSYQEAALELDLPIGTIRSRVSRARDLLKEYILA